MSYNTCYIMIETANWIMRQYIDLGLYTVGTQNAGFLKSTCFVTWTKCMDNMNMQYKLYWCLRNESAPVVGLLMYFTLCVFMYNNNHRCSCVIATHITHSFPYSKSITFSKHITSYTEQETHIWSTLVLHIHLHISQHVKIARYTNMFIYGLLVFDIYKHRESNHGYKYTPTRSLFPVLFMSNFKNSLAFYNASEYRF